MIRAIQLAVASVAVLAATAGQVQAGILLIEDQGGFGNAANVLTSNGFSVTVVNNEFSNNYANLRNPGFLAGFDFIVYGERGSGIGAFLPADVGANLEAYIQGGGHLLLTGYDTLGNPTDDVVRDLIRSSSSGDQSLSDPTWATANVDNPILNGPFGDFRNLSFSATGYDNDNLTANTALGAIALAEFNTGQDRVIFTDLPGTGGSVGYWNGGLPSSLTNAQPDFSDGGNPQGIFLNYAAFATNDVSAVPEPSSLALFGIVACVAGLGAARRRRREKQQEPTV